MEKIIRDDEQKFDVGNIIRQTARTIVEYDPDPSITIENVETDQKSFSTTTESVLSDLDAFLRLDLPKEEPEEDSSCSIQVQASRSGSQSEFRVHDSAAISISGIDSSTLSQPISKKRPLEKEGHNAKKWFKTSLAPADLTPQVQNATESGQGASQRNFEVATSSHFLIADGVYGNILQSNAKHKSSMMQNSNLPHGAASLELSGVQMVDDIRSTKDQEMRRQSFSKRFQFVVDVNRNISQLNAIRKISNKMTSVPTHVDGRSATVFKLMNLLKTKIDQRVEFLHREHGKVCLKGNRPCRIVECLDFFKKNAWTDKLKKLVCDIAIKVAFMLNVKSIENRDKALKIFLMREIIPLWPEGWVTFVEVACQCKKIFGISKWQFNRQFWNTSWTRPGSTRCSDAGIHNYTGRRIESEETEEVRTALVDPIQHDYALPLNAERTKSLSPSLPLQLDTALRVQTPPRLDIAKKRPKRRSDSGGKNNPSLPLDTYVKTVELASSIANDGNRLEQCQIPVQTMPKMKLKGINWSHNNIDTWTRSRNSMIPTETLESEEVKPQLLYLLSKSKTKMVNLLDALSEKINGGSLVVKKKRKENLTRTCWLQRLFESADVSCMQQLQGEWTKELKSMLDAIVCKQLMVLAQDRSMKDKRKALASFLQKTMVPMWPQGRMSVAELMLISHDVLRESSNDKR